MKKFLKILLPVLAVAIIGGGAITGYIYRKEIKNFFTNAKKEESSGSQQKPDTPLAFNVKFIVDEDEYNTTCKFGENVTGFSPTKVSNTFLGWYKKSDEKKTIIDLSNYPILSDETFVARFKLNYTFSGNEITGYDGKELDLVIPSSYSIDSDGNYIEGNDYKVETVNSSFMFLDYSYKAKIKSIKFMPGIKTIGSNLCSSMNSLSTVELPESIETIKSNAFSSCVALQYVNFPNSLKTIESGAFANTSLISINISENLTSVTSNAFQNCDNLKEVKLSTKLSTLNINFSNFYNLKKIFIPKSITTIKKDIFSPRTVLFTDATEKPAGWDYEFEINFNSSYDEFKRDFEEPVKYFICYDIDGEKTVHQCVAGNLDEKPSTDKEGKTFIDWMKDGKLLSTDYDYTVNCNANYTALFANQGEFVEVPSSNINISYFSTSYDITMNGLRKSDTIKITISEMTLTPENTFEEYPIEITSREPKQIEINGTEVTINVSVDKNDSLKIEFSGESLTSIIQGYVVSKVEVKR